MGKLVIISGPSGVGKSTVLSQVLPRIKKPFFSISATTRTPREGEVDGVDYYFVSKDRFEDMLANGMLLEHTVYVGNYYGTPLEPIYHHLNNGSTVFLDVETEGFAQAKAIFPDAVSIFIAPPSIEALRSRLEGRGTESAEKIKGRLEKAQIELSRAHLYDHVIVNDSVDTAAAQIISILTDADAVSE